jgi:class 3 adenylate cyclase/tetratricopeptide (TPR) repeat protein
MRCPECQFENREGAKFCKKCGAKLELACPKCNSALTADSIFCDECGYDLRKPVKVPPVDYSQPQFYTPKFLAEKILTTRSSIEGERKLVTVLFADIANYTSMSEKLDPEEIHQIMDGFFKILMDEIHKYEGTINQFTGDGIMAIFGAPVSHEDHAQRACYAALLIQKAIGDYGAKVEKDCGIEFKMRIGLNSGPVIVGSIGDDLRMDYTAVGDTTNLASRMESEARPGRILVSKNTNKIARDFFEFEPIGKVEIKGKQEPQAAYELIKTGVVETRIKASVAKGLTKFVGRKNSMAGLNEPYGRVLVGSGQVVGIVGEAGVGKSRLLYEFVKQLSVDDVTCLEGRCLHYGGSMIYMPILEILKTYFDIKEEDREFIINKKIKEKILALNEKLAGVIAPFQELLSIKVEDEAYAALEPRQKREKTFEALRDLFIRESQSKPLVLVIEDLHWIDTTSEEFLDYLIGWLANARIMLILLYRPEYTHQWGSKSYYTKIGLTQLGNSSSSQLVKAILEEGEVAPELRQLILNRAAGNPLFMEEFTYSLIENGSIQKDGRQFVLSTKAADIQVPDTIQGIIAARMDRLEDNLKRTMQVASVIGREFAFRILQTITGMREEIKSYLLNLQGLEFIYEKSLFPELEYIFKHALTQEVAYNSLLLKRRKEIHEKIGKAMETLYPDRLEEHYEMLAYHYAQSSNPDKAVEYLDLANQKASKVHALEQAKAYFDEAMKHLDTLPETEENRRRRISLIVNQGEVFHQLFKFPEYYELLTRYEPMAEGLGNPELLGAFIGRLGHCHFGFGQYDQAIQSLTKAAKLCESAGNAEDAGHAYCYLEWSLLFRGNFDRVLAVKEDLMRTMGQLFNLRWYVMGLCAASRAYICFGRWDEAVEEAQKALNVAEEFSDNSLIIFATWALSLTYAWKGDSGQALEYGEFVLQRASTPADKGWAGRGLGWALCRAGEPMRGIELLNTALAIFQSGCYMPGVIPTTCTLGDGYRLAGDYDKAKQTLEEGLEIADRCGARYYAGFAQRLLGEMALKTNQGQVTSHLDKSIAIFREIKAENELALAYASYGRFYKQQGDMAQAREYLTRAMEVFERLGTLIEPDKVREELDELPED